MFIGINRAMGGTVGTAGTTWIAGTVGTSWDSWDELGQLVLYIMSHVAAFALGRE